MYAWYTFKISNYLCAVKLLVPYDTVHIVTNRGIHYKEVAQTVLLYGSDIWVVILSMLKVLEGFHYWEYRRIMGMLDRNAEEGEWD